MKRRTTALWMGPPHQHTEAIIDSAAQVRRGARVAVHLPETGGQRLRGQSGHWSTLQRARVIGSAGRGEVIILVPESADVRSRRELALAARAHGLELDDEAHHYSVHDLGTQLSAAPWPIGRRAVWARPQHKETEHAQDLGPTPVQDQSAEVVPAEVVPAEVVPAEVVPAEVVPAGGVQPTTRSARQPHRASQTQGSNQGPQQPGAAQGTRGRARGWRRLRANPNCHQIRWFYRAELTDDQLPTLRAPDIDGALLVWLTSETGPAAAEDRQTLCRQTFCRQLQRGDTVVQIQVRLEKQGIYWELSAEPVNSWGEQIQAVAQDLTHRRGRRLWRSSAPALLRSDLEAIASEIRRLTAREAA